LIGGTQRVIIGNTIVTVGGDLITAADGVAVNSAEEFRRLLRRRLPGDIIKLDLLRQGKRGLAEVKLGERPRERIALKEQ
jgi:S1-C subfamily serine protease